MCKEEDGSVEHASEESERWISSRVIRDRKDVQEKIQDESSSRKSSEYLNEKVEESKVN